MKRLLFVLAFMFSSLALAEDIHVLLDTDGDGFANPCTNTAHDDSYATDTVACGGTFDIDNDGTAEKIYCNLQSALDDAVTCGDTVEIHAGTWDNNDTTATAILNFCKNDTNDKKVLMTVKSANCTNEAGRRWIRGAQMNNSQDLPIITLTGLDANGAMSLGLGSNDNVDYVTVDHLDFMDAVSQNGCLLPYVAVINVQGKAHYARFTGNTFRGDDGDDVDGDETTLQTPSQCPNAYNVAEDSLVAIGTGQNAAQEHDFYEIDNNTINMCGFLSARGNNTDCACRRNGWDIHHNNITITDDAQLGAGEVQLTCNWVFRNNTWFTPNSAATAYGPSIKFRRGSGSLFVFNNYFRQTKTFAFMQGVRHNASTLDGKVAVFNNTGNDFPSTTQGFIKDGTGSDGCTSGGTFGIAAISVNNSWELTAGAVWDDFKSGDDTTGYEHWTGGNYVTALAPATDLGHQVCTDNLACGLVTAYTQCGGTPTTCDATNPGRPLTDAAPWGLTSGSILIGAGYNDPLGQGAGVCSIPLWTGHTVDCTVDYDGQARGAVWDVGADEFSACVDTGCGDGCVGGAETCDDGDTSVTACVYGDTTPYTQVCDADCIGDVNCSSPTYCGDSAINGPEQCDGALLGGATCVSRGYDSGTLACSACAYDESGCVGAPAASPSLRGAVIKGGTVK